LIFLSRRFSNMDRLKFGWRVNAMTGCMKCDIEITADNYHHEWTLMCDTCYGVWHESVKVETGENGMSWTTEYPTKPGFYWIRNWTIADTKYSSRVGSGPDVVEIDHDLDHFSWTGDALGAMRNQVVSAEWQGPIEPEADKCNRVEFKPFPRFACSTCGKVGNSFISWPTQVADGPHAHRHHSLICRECWIAVLTPEQRWAYKV